MQQKTIVIVGAGIVGISSAWYLLKAGHQVTIIDREPSGDGASFGNAGGIAVTEIVPAAVPGVFFKIPGWLLDPLGPLSLRWSHAHKLFPWMLRFSQVSRTKEMLRIARALTALNSRTYDDLIPMLADCKLKDKLYNRGALSVYESHAAFGADAAEWDLKRQHGIVCDPISGNDARSLEPALGSIVCKAMFTPGWSQVSDPKEIHTGIMDNIRRMGATIHTGNVHGISAISQGMQVECEGQAPITADEIVIAAGAWSHTLAKSIGDRVLLESERGYNTTLPAPEIEVKREIIFAERKFVATPLACGLRIGGAAEFRGLDSKPNYKRSEALVKLAKKYFPKLNGDNGVQWSGHRPATPDSLPIIGRSPSNDKVIHAFGHGHLGLTQAATTGRLVSDLVDDKPAVVDLSPYAIDRF